MPLRRSPPVLMRKLASLGRLPVAEVLTTLRVLVLVAVVEVAVRFTPLPRLTERLGIDFGTRSAVTEIPTPTTWTATEKRQVRSARRVARNWMFGPGPCLRESLVIGYLLRERHPRLELGVARDGRDLGAHAWLEIGDATIGAQGGYEPFDWIES